MAEKPHNSFAERLYEAINAANSAMLAVRSTERAREGRAVAKHEPPVIDALAQLDKAAGALDVGLAAIELLKIEAKRHEHRAEVTRTELALLLDSQQSMETKLASVKAALAHDSEALRIAISPALDRQQAWTFINGVISGVATTALVTWLPWAVGWLRGHYGI
jgi:hypothetical protein